MESYILVVSDPINKTKILLKFKNPQYSNPTIFTFKDDNITFT